MYTQKKEETYTTNIVKNDIPTSHGISKNILIAIGVCILLVGIYIGNSISTNTYSSYDFSSPENHSYIPTLHRDEIIGSGTPQSTYTNIIPYNEIKEVYTILSKYSYDFESTQKSDIGEGIVRGMVYGLGDQHSIYMSSKESKEFSDYIGGDFEGIGAILGTKSDGSIYVEKPLPKSPAYTAGLLPNDIIKKVDDVSTQGKNTDEVVKLIRGAAGSIVQIQIERKGLTKDIPDIKNIPVIRQKLQIPTVISEILTGNIAYIQMSIFGEHTTTEFATEIANVLVSSPKGLILDLRGNGGGLLDAAVDIASYFLPVDTPVVSTVEKNKTHTQILKSYTQKINTYNIPLIVLIDEYSASASEILAGVIQDSARGIIVGTKSYGKGSVQEVFPLSNGSTIKITTAKWYTQKGNAIDKKGIIPDISVTKDATYTGDIIKIQAIKTLERYISTDSYTGTILYFQK